jgi:2'-5' RNA ligase
MRHATARLFVAVDPPAAVCAELGGWIRRSVPGLECEQNPGALRLLAPEAMHITLCFLGEVAVETIDAISQALLHLTPDSVGELELGAPVWLPPRRPRALAVEIHDDAGRLSSLRADVVRAMGQACGFEAERRRFRAHLTVARTRSGNARGSPLAQPHPPTATPALRFVPEALVLYRSLLAKAGASYQALATYRLA